ncbi:MAG: ribonuclease HII, partial [Flavobacteriaceae bacterium]
PIFKTVLKEASHVKSTNFASWALFDISPKSEKLQLSGVVLGKDSTSFVNLFKGTHPLPHKIADFAPPHVESILSYTFDEYRSFEKNRMEYLGLTTHTDSLFNTTEEVGILTFDGQKSIMVQTYGPAVLSDFIKSRQKQSSHHQGHEIMDLGQGDFLVQALSPLVPAGEYRYCSILDNTFVFSEQEAAQKKIISGHSNGNNFRKSATYQSISGELATESTLLYIANANGMTNMVTEYFGKELRDDMDQTGLKTYAYGTQLIADDQFFHCHILAKRTDSNPGRGETVPLFNVQLEHPVQTLPQFVVNHSTRGRDIVVQDQSNTLYLISSKGSILWKKQLKSPIQGGIRQVDLYKNGKLQLAFTTNDQFLILDRNGKEVGPFNMEFEGGNLNELAVFDYDKRKNYRFVVTQGEKVFMYNTKGEIVKGFTYVRAESPILRTPKHFRIGGKDYLVFQLENGSLKILNRVGNIRVKVPQKIDFSDNEVYLLNNKFTLTDQKGILYQIGANGKMNTADAKLFKDHGLFTTSKTLVTMSDNILSIKGKKVELELGVYTHPHIFYIYDKIYVSVTDMQNQKVYLFDSQARPIPHFPVYGTSAADLSDVDNDRRLELITVTSDNEVQLYRF